MCVTRQVLNNESSINQIKSNQIIMMMMMIIMMMIVVLILMLKILIIKIMIRIRIVVMIIIVITIMIVMIMIIIIMIMIMMIMIIIMMIILIIRMEKIKLGTTLKRKLVSIMDYETDLNGRQDMSCVEQVIDGQLQHQVEGRPAT